jgi:hypothetical protein
MTKVRIIFWNYVFEADERMSCIQNLSGGYNLNSDNIFFGTHKNCQNLIVPNVLSYQQQKIGYVDYFLMTDSFGSEPIKF